MTVAKAEGSETYDVHDDETLPYLQTATHEAKTHGLCAVHLRQSCLARIKSISAENIKRCRAQRDRLAMKALP